MCRPHFTGLGEHSLQSGRLTAPAQMVGQGTGSLDGETAPRQGPGTGMVLEPLGMAQGRIGIACSQSQIDGVSRPRCARPARRHGQERGPARGHGCGEAQDRAGTSDQDRTERRDPVTLYNKIDRKGLVELAPSFAWDAYLAALGRPELHDIVVTTPAYKARFEELLTTVKPRQWGHYLEWQIMHQMAPSSPKKFVDEDFALVRMLTDQPRLQPRWKRCIDATDLALGDLLGQRYVAERFAGDSKHAAATLVGEIRAAFAAELARLPWMAPATRDKAGQARRDERIDRVSRHLETP